MKNVFSDIISILTFRFSGSDIARLNRTHLIVGLVCTWIVGMGRYWDNPRAELLQKLGVGSLVYVFVLALFLWLVIWPLRSHNWSYKNILTFVSLTSPPAILYAIPVERFTTLETASSLNVLFLAVVAIWRVALLVLYLIRHSQLSVIRVIVGSLLPLVLIVSGLSILNLEHAVFDIMAGLQKPGTSADAAFKFVVMLTFYSWILLPILLILYITLMFRRNPRTE